VLSISICGKLPCGSHRFACIRGNVRKVAPTIGGMQVAQIAMTSVAIALFIAFTPLPWWACILLGIPIALGAFWLGPLDRAVPFESLSGLSAAAATRLRPMATLLTRRPASARGGLSPQCKGTSSSGSACGRRHRSPSTTARPAARSAGTKRRPRLYKNPRGTERGRLRLPSRLPLVLQPRQDLDGRALGISGGPAPRTRRAVISGQPPSWISRRPRS
jgi:hypothetical protein